VVAVVVETLVAAGVGRADFVMYVSDPGTGDIDKVNSAGVVSIYATGFSNPQGLALDSSGNLYVANNGTGKILVVPPGGGSSSVFASLPGAPYGMAFDGSGNLLVAVGTTIYKVDSQGNATSFFTASNGNNLRGLAIDSSTGYIYAASILNGGSIFKISSTDGTSYSTVSGTSGYAPIGLAFSGTNLFFTSGSNGVYKVTTSGPQEVSGTNSASPYGLGFDSTGNLFFVNLTSGPLFSTPTIDETTTANNFLQNDPLSMPSFLLVAGSLSAVPEPSTLTLSFLAALGAAVYLRRRAQRKLGPVAS
jgi:DNA-binding beta-propeller fold protein YncE